MPGPVERWLETFMCSQYAKLFDDYGFKTLQSVCQLQMSHLQSMGIHPTHRNVIYQNVEVLRQSSQGPLGYREEGYLRNRISQDMPTSGYEGRDQQQMNSMNPNFNQHMSMHGSYGNQRAMMQQFSGAGPYSQNPPAPQQPPYPGSGFKQEYPNTVFQGHNRASNEMESNNFFPRQPNPFSPPSGGQGSSQGNMHHSHMHRNCQNPQEVANNILHMASSSYPQYNTVQVPLSKGRSAPYHVPHRSGHYGMMSPNESQLQQYQQIQQMQFTYPTSSSQVHQSPHSAMSPSSPASATVMSSPHSIHSGHGGVVSSPHSIHSGHGGVVSSPHSIHSGHGGVVSSPHSIHSGHGGVVSSPHSIHSGHGGVVSSPHSIHSGHGGVVSSPHSIHSGHGGVVSSPHSIHSGQCSSPASIHSPRMSCVRSPGSDMGTGMMRTPEGGVANLMNQQMNSPQRSQQYPMSSPVGTPHSRMVSPVPVHQQLQVSTSSSIANQYQQNYRDMSNMVSPSGSTTKSHYSSCSNVQPSPGGQSVQHSGISSPYTPGSHPSPGSPSQQHYSNYLTKSGHPADNGHQTSNTNQGNPLQSLQKLCMLPESRVVDPKSVVNDTCAPSPQNLECSRTVNPNNNYQQSPSELSSRMLNPNNDYQQTSGEMFSRTTNSHNNHQHTSSNSQTNNGETSSGSYGMNQSRGDALGDQPTHTSDNSMGSTHSNLSNKPPVGPGASSAVDSIQASNTTSPSVTNSEINNSVFASSNEGNNVINNECETPKIDTETRKIPNDNNESAIIDQQGNASNSEELKCQPKKMKLLRATNQTVCPSPTEPECMETQHDIKTIDTELYRDMNTHSVIDTPTDTVNEGGDNGDNSINHLEVTHGNIACPTDQNTEIKDTIMNSNEEDDKLALNGNSNDLINETAATKVTEEERTEPALLDSDEDSHLSVRKDTKTYSKSDGLTPVDHQNGCVRSPSAGRVRSPSAGSLSDDVIGSDIDYEDHIGCDDIENSVSDMEEKENCEIIKEKEILESVPDVSKKESDMLGFDVKSTDNHVISSPHWKKSHLNNLNSGGKNKKEPGKKVNGSRKKGKNGIKANVNVVPLNGSADNEIDMEVPSPNGDIDGVGIETRGGTMFLTQAHRFLHRSRKAPLKYKDTSFYQGEFMFDDEDNDVDFEPKSKLAKRDHSVDFNHNKDKSDKGLKGMKPCDKRKDAHLTNGGQVNNEKLVKSSKDRTLHKNNLNESDKSNTSKTAQSGGLNKNGIHDLQNSDCELTEKPTEGNESDIVSKKRRNKPKTNVQQKATRSSGTSETPNKTNKGKTPIDVQSKPTPKTTFMKTKINIKPSDHKKTKPLNGLQSLKETRDKTKNCNFEKQNHKEETKRKPRKHLSATVVPEASDSDGESDVVLISDDDDDDESSVPLAKLSHINKKPSSNGKTSVPPQNKVVKKEPNTAVDNKLLARVCDGKESDSEDSVCSKPVQKDKEQSKQGRVESKTKSKTKSQKKRRSKDSQKSHKKFLFESDEEFDPNSVSLKAMLNKTQHMLKKSQKPKKSENSSDFKGPMVRIEGSKEAPDKCVVINERLETTSSGKAKPLPQGVATRIQISHLPSDKSVLVPQAKVEEGNQWLCALCGKHSSYRFLGDLFGPYTVDDSLDTDPSNINVKPVSKKRKSDESLHGANKPSRTSHRVGGVSREADTLQEVWIHESCSVWSDGVYLIGSKIYGLKEAIAVAHQTPCTHCLEMGAMIGCLNKGCKEKYHYSCALQIDCYMDEENFSLLCPKHKVKKLKPPAPSTSSSIT